MVRSKEGYRKVELAMILAPTYSPKRSCRKIGGSHRTECNFDLVWGYDRFDIGTIAYPVSSR
jgi:hypothetical protein